MEILKAATVYFLYVFGAGFLLGCIRVPFLVPRLGARTAELIEMPFMASVIWFSAHAVVKQFTLAPTLAVRLAVGGIALLFVLSAEVVFIKWMQANTVSQYIASRDIVSGLVFIVMLLGFALMPIWVH